MRKHLIFFITYLFIFLNFSLSAQIKIKELPSSNPAEMDSSFLDLSATRSIIQLNSKWSIYSPDDAENKVSISVPSSYEGENTMVYERSIYISGSQIKNNQLYLEFYGVNYSADILFNNLVIFKHPGGIYPFSVELPEDVIKPDAENMLLIRISHRLDDINTIPVEQRFLFPTNPGGILRDVFLKSIPKIHIAKFQKNYGLSSNFNSADLDVKISLENTIDKKHRNGDKSYKIALTIEGPQNKETVSKEIDQINSSDITEAELKMKINNPQLWSPNNPVNYKIKINLTENDSLIDQRLGKVSFYRLTKEKSQFTLNGKPFSFKGITYIHSDEESGRLISYKNLRRDLELIKKTGFNTVRFSKSLPYPLEIEICQELGLFSFIELPLTSIPDEIIKENTFVSRAESLLKTVIGKYASNSTVAAVGLGGSYLPDDNIQKTFIRNLGELIKKESDKLTYASFVQLPPEQINYIDLYGVELYNEAPQKKDLFLEKIENLGASSVLISSATYPTYKGNSNGYLNKFSYEGQAKFFSDVIDFSKTNNLSGFFINTLYDYKGDFPSLYSGYSAVNNYSIGLLKNYSEKNGISFRVVESKLTGGEKITIPIGSAKDDSPFEFIIIGLALSIFMGLLINSKRKFREDAGRALMRPYNFFADVRDLRILSGLQTNILMLILTGSLALAIINLLFYLRHDIIVEKIMLSFASPFFLKALSYLAWHPIQGFLILWAAAIFKFLFFAAIIKIFSLFLKNKVILSSIYYSVIWSFLPLALLLPLELVLYRILIANVANLYIYLFLGIFFLWLLQRLLKGVHVIFDVRPSVVYFYSFIFILGIVGGFILYYQLKYSTIYYILNALKEYQFI